MKKVKCPVCHKVYEPVLGERKHPEMLIQREFPQAESWQREQLASGVCSDECWKTLFSTEVEDVFGSEEDAVAPQPDPGY